jgi:hypothetical protein
MDSTGSALRDAAAKLRAGESQLLSQDPEQGFGRIDVDRLALAVYPKSCTH